VKPKIPLAELILSRMQALGLSAETLGLRLGYQNPGKAAGRVQALCDGHLENERSQAALARLAAALEVPDAVVQEALTASRQLIAELQQRLAEQNRHTREVEEDRWRAEFKPHAVIETERRRPDQIVFCGLTGGVERWLIIRFDLSMSPITFVEQAVHALAKRPGDKQGRPIIPFFGLATGFVVNYSPDRAVRFDIRGNAVEVLPQACRVGEIQLSVGDKNLSPTRMARMLGIG
jgi:hypothetical protein